MSADRLREMLSEATSGPWHQEAFSSRFRVQNAEGRITAFYLHEADARLIAIAPDAIALLADMGEAIAKHQRHSPCDECEELLARLDALCGEDRA